MLGLALVMLVHAAPLSDAIARYDDLDYEGCVTALATNTSKLHGTPRATAELYFGLCEFALGREGEARRHLDTALRLDANLKPPANASPKERELFDAVSLSVASTPRPQPPPAKRPAPRRPEAPEAEPARSDAPVESDVPAAADPVEPKPATPAPPVVIAPAELPPAAPSRVPAVALTVGFAAFAIAGTAMTYNAKLWESAENREPGQIPAAPLAQQANTRIIVADVLFGVALVAAAIATWLWIRVAAQ